MDNDHGFSRCSPNGNSLIDCYEEPKREKTEMIEVRCDDESCGYVFESEISSIDEYQCTKCGNIFIWEEK